jgi:hypothetical protein
MDLNFPMEGKRRLKHAVLVVAANSAYAVLVVVALVNNSMKLCLSKPRLLKMQGTRRLVHAVLVMYYKNLTSGCTDVLG